MSEKRDVKQPDIKTIIDIINNYVKNEKTIVSQLHYQVAHGVTIGGFRENVWQQMFRQIIPEKFAIERSVFIIDSQGKVSNEVDLAIFDETYTPYIFRYESLKFLPIEAVAVVIECKSQSFDKDNLKNWAESVEALTTSDMSYVRTINRIVDNEKVPVATQTSTRPLRILCCLNNISINSYLDSGDKIFDIIVRSPSDKEDLEIEFDPEKVDLQDWYLALNHKKNNKEIKEYKVQDEDKEFHIGKILKGKNLEDYKVSKSDKPVNMLTFNMQLNQLLMLINNPMLFPHKAYAKMFNKYGTGEFTDEKTDSSNFDR